MTSVLSRRPTPASLHGRSPWFWLGVWLPALLAVAIICRESTPTFSAVQTSGWLRPFFERLLGPIRDDRWWLFHHLLRKSGHFLGYGTVGLTFLRAWLYTLARRPVHALATRAWRTHAFVFALLCTALVASLDEWHQTFLPSRTGQVSDVLLDTTGALLLCGLALLFTRRAATD